jgi:hypothetical protein
MKSEIASNSRDGRASFIIPYIEESRDSCPYSVIELLRCRRISIYFLLLTILYSLELKRETSINAYAYILYVCTICTRTSTQCLETNSLMYFI